MSELVIERLGHLGDGIAKGPVFVPLTLPGELVAGEVTGDRMETPRILRPSEDRVSAPCRHFRACGGCSLQHASDPFVASWKSDVVRAALSAHGIDIAVARIDTSPERSRRRAVFSGRRTKKGVLVGLHGRASGTIVEVPDCRIMSPAIMAALPALEALVAAGASRKAEMSLAVIETERGADVAVRGGKPLDQALRIGLSEVVGTFGLTRLYWDGEQIAQDAPIQRFGRATVIPPAGAFLQATHEGEAALLAYVRQAVGKSKKIADLFAGCGTFSLPLAEGAEIHAVESEAAMLSALDRGWRAAPGLKLVTTEARDLFRRPLLPDELDKFNAVVLDPPRAGCEAQVEELAHSKVSKVVSVSCNPVTFARDSKILIDAGYSISDLIVVDQFRWSPHIEAAATFTRL
ncbi:23S rRNA (uracil(1939)-C(5))-methyltransferase RlmD [Aquimixticola soesokkakensis]|uniref:23S rRNA (Uracil(1939)-C(5))-methyltransferase RlmD n=1 Tax=Aquimixticola soesokkakensis TaxID=1519096 RepID=A0A1Y5R8D3_9RHOB|nr:class I SAM-dependent RNA methyltransferase [Aquimixticola soesokkakensis]SLN11163.1 23S rRNA (uracil(1939)-C(5))-methyltransferase RlmD [Aquimixticola soesokkakensis]